MEIKWTSKAVSDIVRLHEFLSPVNPRAAVHVVQSLTLAPTKLLKHPRLGQRLEQYNPREVRRILVGSYELRYELEGSVIHILRLWHSREDRG